MQVHFSPHLDGLDPAPPKTQLGVISVGSEGLLRLLESDLGLPPVQAHAAEIIVAYRKCLTRQDHPQRFYHRSLQVDPIGVARTLLRWRNDLYLAGWQGQFDLAAPQRLADLAAVESLARQQVPANAGQRLQRICAALTQRRTQISQLWLHETYAALPYQWQCLLDHLPCEEVSGLRATVHAPADTDLGRLQALLCQPPTPGPVQRLTLQQDGSFVVVKAASRDLSAQAISELLQQPHDPHATVVIAEQDGIIVDNALARGGLPRLGFQHFSSFRAVSQVLKLCLALLWEPLNPHVLLQFLIHPLGPLPGNVRQTLADAVAREPGVGGRAWQQAVQHLHNQLERREASEADHEQLRQSLQTWFFSPRYSPDSGAPVHRVAARIETCRNWLTARIAGSEDPVQRSMFVSAAYQASTLLQSLQSLHDADDALIKRNELERLVDEVSSSQPNPDLFAEAGRARASTQPANITHTFERVIWWDLAYQAHDDRYPWSQAEMQALQAAGVQLPAMDAVLQHRSRGWLRPVLNCTTQCILVVHDDETGEHPLWIRLQNMLDNWARVDIETALLDGETDTLAHLQTPMQAQTVQLLPAPKRWWQLPADATIAVRPEESYSSLNKLINYPHEWIFDYQARLRTGRSQDIADGPLLYGLLAHRLFEEFFRQQPDWQALAGAEIDVWVQSQLPLLIQQEGAVLLEPGRGLDRERVTTTLAQAMHHLLRHLRAAGVQQVVAEQSLNTAYGSQGQRLGGTIDLLLTLANGQRVVVDAKWGSEQYRGAELEQNRHLQLTSYAYLLKQANQLAEWPYQAYFIISSGNMLAADTRVFADASVWAPEGGSDPADLWARSQATYAWRWQQFAGGRIEINRADTEPTPASEAPQDALQPDKQPDPYDDYRHLTGWDSFS